MKNEFITIRLKAEDRKRLREIAEQESNTVSGVIRQFLNRGFKEFEERHATEF